MSIEAIVYRVYQATKELHFVPAGNGRWRKPDLSKEIIENALLDDEDPILIGTFTSYREAKACLERKFPVIRVDDPEGMGIKYIPVYGAYIMECEIEVDDDNEECEMYSEPVEFSEYHAKVDNASGVSVDFNAALTLMDEEIRKKLHREMGDCTDQEFFTEYEREHEKKYGKEWELSGYNPQY